MPLNCPWAGATASAHQEGISYLIGLLLAGRAVSFKRGLARNASGCVGRGGKSVITDRLPALDACAVEAGGDACQRSVDLLQFMEIVPREGSAQLVARLARCGLVGMRLGAQRFGRSGSGEISVFAVQRRQQLTAALAEPLL